MVLKFCISNHITEAKNTEEDKIHILFIWYFSVNFCSGETMTEIGWGSILEGTHML